MIVDTSALVAILLAEPNWRTLRAAIAQSPCIIPAPVLLELQLATAKQDAAIMRAAQNLIGSLVHDGAAIAAFESKHADLTAMARERYGKGNGRGGLLNFGDLMVYAIAKQRDEPILCTGRAFASTDVEIHPASRLDP